MSSSKAIYRAAYNKQKKELVIQFRDTDDGPGHVYIYYDVEYGFANLLGYFDTLNSISGFMKKLKDFRRSRRLEEFSKDTAMFVPKDMDVDDDDDDE